MSTITLSKWGNALGVRIPQAFAKQLKLSPGDKVNITLENNELVISKQGPTLQDLLAGCTSSNQHQEHFEVPMGKEIL